MVPLALQQTRTVQSSEAVMYGKIRVWLSFPNGTQRTPTAATSSQYPHKQQLRSDTPFYITGNPLAADVGSRKNSTTLKRQPRANNEVNDFTVRGFPIVAGGR